MTIDAMDEIRALRTRLAQLEQMAAGTARKGPTTMDHEAGAEGSIAADNELLQDRLRAEAWTFDEQMEAAIARLERNPDDPALAGGLRMGIGFYQAGRAAAQRAGKDTTGGQS